MALQMATNISPDSLNGVGGAVFDASAGLNVTWQVNGVSPMLAYRIVIMENDTESTQLYTTGKVVLDEPFSGVNYKGETVYFEAETISAADLSGAGIANGNSYKMVITQWWGATDEESVTQSSASLIEAWTPPTLTMGAIPNPLAGRTYSFTASYAQAEGDTIAWVRWRIAAQGQEDSPLLDTGNIYGTSQLRADYDSFFTGTSYTVRCDVETNAGQEATTGWQTVNVLYPTIAPNGILDVDCRCDGGVGVSWSTARTAIGKADGAYTIEDGKIVLPSGTVVTWDEENGNPISYPSPWSVLWRGNPAQSNGGSLFRVETESGVLTASIASATKGTATVTASLNGTAIGTVNITTPPVYLDRTWTLIVTADTFYVGYAEGTGGLYPSQSLYPEDTLYPQGNTGYATTLFSTPLPYTQGTILSASLIGAQTASWFWITGETMDAAQAQSIIQDAEYEPAWGDSSSTFLLATFVEGLNAGNLNTTGYTLFRRNLTTGTYEFVGEFGINNLSVIDYSVCNNHGYVYQLWYTDVNTYTSTPIESQEITPFSWSYYILACTETEDGTYHVEKVYPFSANIVSGNVTNNNTPKLQRNFTRYPSWQPDTAMYKSGKLKAFIGQVNAYAQYVGDTVEYADELRELCQSNRALFLKDRRGELLQIKTNGPVVTAVEDKYSTQSVTIEIPWVEVGSAEGVSIVADPTDAIWQADGITETSVDIDLETGMLVWTHPNGYSTTYTGSSLRLNESGTLVHDSSPWYTPADLSINSQQNLIATD